MSDLIPNMQYKDDLSETERRANEPTEAQRSEDAARTEATRQENDRILNNGGVVYRGDADQAQSDLVEAQRADFDERFAPLEDELMGKITASTEPEADRAGRKVRQQERITRGSFMRDLARSGASATAPQKKSIRRARSLAKATGAAGAENMTRRETRDQNMETKGAVIGIGRGIQQAANRDLSTASGLQSTREQGERQAKAIMAAIFA